MQQQKRRTWQLRKEKKKGISDVMYNNSSHFVIVSIQ